MGIKEGKVTLTHSTVTGSGVSCLQDGSWGFACSTDEKDLFSLPEKAVKAAERSLVKKNHCHLAPAPVIEGTWVSPVKEPITEVHLDLIIEFLRRADEVAREYPGVISRQITLLSTCDEKEIATSEGTHLTQKEHRLFCTAAVTARAQERRCTTNNAVGGQVGREFFATEELDTMVREECERAVRLLTAKMPPAGKSTAVLMPEVASVLMHEAVGHTAEADVVSGGSYLSGRLGEKVGTEYITLLDDGTYKKGFGTYGFDDEGVASQKTAVIEKGYLKTYLHSRETAHGSQPTGNARAWLYSGEPLIRMTNTYLEPRDYKLDELIETVGEGFLLKGVTSGLADHFGNFTLYVPEAQKIEHRTLLPVTYSGVTVSANAFELLSSTTAVGDHSTFALVPGVCGKGETAFVGMGAPALALSMIIGGHV